MKVEERATRTGQFIAATQLPSGAIPWFEGGKTDPWNHVEAAMGLSIAGRRAEAERAYAWLAAKQTTEGYWFAEYDTDGQPQTRRIESNFVAYIATGVWHHYLIYGDRSFLVSYWPIIERAMRYVLTLQAPTGEFFWAEDLDKGEIDEDALVTGCSSIYKSLEATARIATLLGQDELPWVRSRQRLQHALTRRPERFDRTWPSKQRFAMDWFYPVLCGAVRGRAAGVHLDKRAHEFIENGLGCRCVVEEPWVTIAESAELTMALLAAGEREQARTLFGWLDRHQAEDGSWWTGYQFAERVLWPDERPTWTAGAVLLAMDALDDLTPASHLFREHAQ